jgi:integrase
VFGRAVAWRYVTHDPTREVSNVPKARKLRQIQLLAPDQVAALLAASPDYWRPLFLTAVSTGLRRGELFGLTWADVLWMERKIVVRHQLQGGQLVTPKSESARRRIDVGPTLLQVLATHRVVCPRSDLDWCPSPSGLPVHTSDFNRDAFIPAARALSPTWYPRPATHFRVGLDTAGPECKVRADRDGSRFRADDSGRVRAPV